VLINRNLTGAAMDDDDAAPGVVGRWRATMGHEASHVVMHRALFEIDQAEDDLFGAGPRSQRFMRCFKANVLFRGGGNDPREVQANLGMAALLMPRTVFRHVAEAAIQRLAIPAAELVSGTATARRLVREVADLTRVSKQAAEIRLETVRIVGRIGQSSLPWPA
jgi:Zn-dependent peptidase ImmA (M78 family)